MKAPGASRTLALTVAAAGAAAVLLSAYPTARFVVPAVFAIGVVAMARWPAVGATVIVFGQATGLAMGVSHESASGLVAGLAAMYVLGNRSRLPRSLFPVLLAWAVIVATDVAPVRQVLGLALFGAAYALGAVVRQSAERARLAEADARRLEGEEVASRARHIVDQERRRLGRASTRLLISASHEMRERAHAAREDLEPAQLARIRERGENAVEELRSLLDVLRMPRRTVSTPAVPASSRPQRNDVLTAALVSVLALAEWAFSGGHTPVPWWLLLVTAALALRHRSPALGCLVAALGFLGQWMSGDPFVTGPALALSLSLLIWSAVAALTTLRVAAVLTLAGTCLLATSSVGNNSVEVAVGILLGAALGSRVWSAFEGRHAAARARTLAYSRRLQTTVDDALSDERLRVARDLHDVASRAIGIMLMHTSVAEVNRTADPAKARAALATVGAAGASALTELAALERALASGHGDHLSATVPQLVDQMRDSGLDVSLHLAAQPRDAEVAAVVWRVVHEALTNVLKHAPGSRVEVSVRRDGHELVVTVRDDGSGLPGRGVGTGHGLLGLSELVERCHGSLRHGPVQHSGATGFEVVARLADPHGSTAPPRPSLSEAHS